MFKFLKDRKKDNKGFTLVELVIVVAILAILVGLLAPQYTKYVEKSRKSADVDNMEEIVKAIQVYAVDNSINIKNGTTANAEIKITLKDSGVEITKDADGAAAAALTEYVPNYTKTARKSKQWSADPNVTLKITPEGGVSVDYQPKDFATYTEGKTTSNNTNQNNNSGNSGTGN